MHCNSLDPMAGTPCERGRGHHGWHGAHSNGVILEWPDEQPKPRSCDYSEWSGELVSAACPECGHTSLVHPGRHNPSLAECVLCWLTDRGGERRG